MDNRHASFLINDEDVIDLYQQNNKNECKKTKNFDISAQQTVAILFTSGTTGEAKKNPKTWGLSLKPIQAFKCSGVAIRIFGSGVSNAIC
jgi:acyl-coenzyme A synthetase/AMP-(fatty) acid ligase